MEFTHGPNTTIIGALTQAGVSATMTLTGAVDRSAFETFVSEVLSPTLRAGQVVVMDNLKAHKGDRVRQLIEATGARLVFLLPYTPELNPIELCWAKLKALIRRQEARTVAALDEAIAAAFAAITASDAHGWFAHCGYVASLK